MPCEDCSPDEYPPDVEEEECEGHCFDHWPHCCYCGATPANEEECTHESWEVTRQWRDKETDKWRQRRRCTDCDEWLEDALVDESAETVASPQPERRPPYAVAYSVDGGHFYEALLPGDATAVAEDGVLKIQHTGAVLAIVRVQPVQTGEGDG